MLLQLLFIDPAAFIMITIAILLSLSLHEYFHAGMAFFLGDPTPKYAGRLTINPLAHIDPFGILLLFLVGFGWGKPVPFNPANLRNQKWGPALVGLAGPSSNFLMALATGIILRLFSLSAPNLIFFFSIFVWINLLLGVFNLIPVPPLDGSHIFFTLFPSLKRANIFTFQNMPFFTLIAILFMFFIGIPFVVKPLFALITGIPIALLGL